MKTFILPTVDDLATAIDYRSEFSRIRSEFRQIPLVLSCHAYRSVRYGNGKTTGAYDTVSTEKQQTPRQSMDRLTKRRGRLGPWSHWIWLAAGLLVLIALAWLTKSYTRPGTVESRPAATVAPMAAPPTAEAPDTGVPAIAQAPPDSPTPPSPTVTSTATPAPTATPSPTVPPTLTPSVEGRLASGIQLHRLGNYAAAQFQLATLLASDNVPREVRLQTQYKLVQSYLAAGAYGEALSILDQLESEQPLLVASGEDIATSQSEIPFRAHYLRATILAEVGRTSEAIAAFHLFLDAYPWMDAAVQPKLAQAYLALGDWTNAAVAYRQAANAASNTVQRVQLLEALAEAHAKTGNIADAVAAYDEILSVAQNGGYRAQIQYLAGQAMAVAGDEEGAVERWRASTNELPDSDAAYQSLIELVNRQIDFDLYQRGVIDLAAQAWQPAANAFQAYLDSVDASDGRAGAALHGLGQAYLGLGNYTDADYVFNRVLAEYPNCECTGQVWLDLASVQAGLGDSVGARRFYRTFAREQAGDPLAAEALWQSGLSALREGNQLETAVDFLTLADAFPDSERAPLALYLVGMGAFQNQLYSQTIDSFTRLQQGYPEYRWEAVTYWLGRAHAEGGNPEQAQSQWEALADRAPDSYYGVLASQSLRRVSFVGGALLSNMHAVARPASTILDDDGSQVFAEQWLAHWLQMDREAMAVLPAAVAQDMDLNIGRMLVDLGQRADALIALDRVYQRYKADPHALYALSLEFEHLEAYRLSLMAMARLLELSPAELVEDAPVFLQQRVYPRRFASLVMAEAAANGLDPLLLFSLIRQESLFDDGARSHASAQGLAQVIPSTGAWIAEQLAYPGYENALIFRPMVNVKFGAYYLDWVRDYLDGNLISALVGYNAGPGNSSTWRERFGVDDTLFVEFLEINEPRIYVQAIASNLYHYTRLYGTQ